MRMTSFALLVATIVVAGSVSGCAITSNSIEMSGKIGESLESIAKLHKNADLRTRQAVVLSEGLKKEGSPIANLKGLERFAGPGGGALFNDARKSFVQLACGEGRFPEVETALADATTINSKIGKLAGPPKDTFAGVTKAIRKERELLKELSKNEEFSERVKEQSKKKNQELIDLKKEGFDCESLTVKALEDPILRQGAGGPISASAVLGFLQATLSLAKAVYGIQEQTLREAALRAFASRYESDVLYALMLLDGRMNRVSDSSMADPKKLALLLVDSKNNRLQKMIDLHRTVVLQRAFVAFSEVTHNTGLGLGEKLRLSSEIQELTSEAKLLGPKDGVEVSSNLTKLITGYFDIVKNGSDSKAESLDLLIESWGKMSDLLDKFDAFKKARGEL